MAGSFSQVALAPNIIIPETWTDPATEWDVRAYSDVEIDFDGTITTPYQPQRRMGATWRNCNVYDADGNKITSGTIATAGSYFFDGYGYLKFSAGAGATLTRRAAA